jgi:hypothetical protein
MGERENRDYAIIAVAVVIPLEQGDEESLMVVFFSRHSREGGNPNSLRHCGLDPQSLYA